mgnify:CR=1 FL=1
MITTAVDIMWLMFWVPYYNDSEISKLNYGLHMFVVVISILEIFLKTAIFFMLFRAQSNNKSQQEFAKVMNNKYPAGNQPKTSSSNYGGNVQMA